jgi:hypothetical protein
MVEEEVQTSEKPLEGREIIILYTDFETGKPVKFLLEWGGGAHVCLIHFTALHMIDELKPPDALIFFISYGDIEELKYLTDLKNKYSNLNIIAISTLIPEHLRSGFGKLKLPIVDFISVVNELIPKLVETISMREGGRTEDV